MPANILLDDMKNPRICDFDVSQFLPVGTTLIRGRRGTDGFMAPEMGHDRSTVYNGYKEWIHLTFELLPTSTRYGPPSRGEATTSR
ncbi:G protein-coupled receptor kinase 5 [Plakobranchus ocellatus]|uniref:G protein-coupled receptor kinase 5 n=1 Tax=Plakobranchus ocellatus TaxID=259542 RepID=A0AAV4DFQ2_9GAST|nr:G protein-coupled receptor kinase 5 [Plakobranchus ocellatus]